MVFIRSAIAAVMVVVAVLPFIIPIPLAPQWRLGLAINPTFADETEYEKNFVGRYSGLKTKIRVINVLKPLCGVQGE